MEKNSELTILIVDDSHEDREIIKRFLSKDNNCRYRFIEAETGQEGFEMSKNHKPDCIILDYKLPDIDGIDWMKCMVDEHKLDDIPIIFNTGQGDETIATESMKSGAQDYLVKDNLNTYSLTRSIRYAIEKKRRQKAEIRYQDLVETAQDAIVCDINGTVTIWNSAAERLFGYLKHEMMGQPVATIIPERLRVAHQERVERLNRTGESVKKGAVLEIPGLAKGGKEIPLEMSLTVQNIQEGGFDCTSIFRDLTERKKTEEELKNSERKMRAWMENSPVCTKIVDLDFNLQYMSPAGTKALKIDDVTKLNGRPYPFEFFPEPFKKSMTKNMIIVRDTGETISEESAACDIEGNELWFHSTIVPVNDADGRTNYLLVVSSDISKRKQVENILLQSEKLKSIGTITAGVSHEFNNILNIISGNIQLLQMDYNDHSKLVDRLRIVHEAIKNGTSITGRMREFTHPDTSGLDFELVDINALIKRSIEFTMPRWKNMAQVKGIDYNVDIECMENISSISCDSGEIVDVLINIINNALDAMPDGGTLAFRTWSKDDTVFVSITDTGKGIAEDIKKDIFDPFFTTRRPEGTGLGLSTSYTKMKSHGGKIEVDSDEGSGSTFTLQFPAANKGECLIAVPDTKQYTIGKSLSVLVVDDEASIRELLNSFLSEIGHNVKTVDGGADAINMIEGEEFDLVLCDLAMPHVYGYDVIKAINKLDKRPKTGIVTGWNEKLKPIDDGIFKVDFILRKPFDLQELAKRIDDLFVPKLKD